MSLILLLFRQTFIRTVIVVIQSIPFTTYYSNLINEKYVSHPPKHLNNVLLLNMYILDITSIKSKRLVNWAFEKILPTCNIKQRWFQTSNRTNRLKYIVIGVFQWYLTISQGLLMLKRGILTVMTVWLNK